MTSVGTGLFGGLGTTTPSTGFGFPAATTSSFSFGQTSTAPTFTGFNTFGTPNTQNSAFSTPFQLGTTNTTPGFSFGNTGTSIQSATPFSLSLPTSNPATTSVGSSLFGGLGSTAAPTGFGFPGTSTSSFSFGPTSTAPSFTGFNTFGTTTTQSNTFASPFQLGVTNALGLGGVATQNPLASMATALSAPSWYGDERDAVLAKWNQLQAFWGAGKGYFATNTPPVEFNPQNHFCRFKAVGYSCLPSNRPEEGLVSLTVQKKESEVRNLQAQYVEQLQRMFSHVKPNATLMVDSLKGIPGDKTELTIYVVERAPTGVSRRFNVQEITAILDNPMVKGFLANLSVAGYLPRVSISKEMLKLYLDNPPAGMDQLLWQQAKLDNPDSEQLLPVPLVGFQELQHRLRCQEQETRQHEERMDVIAEEISELQKRHMTTVAKIAEHKRKQLELGHRVLKLMVSQEISRKMGFAIQVQEENLKVQLENIQSELNAPTQFKGRLNELLSQIRLQNQQTYSQSEERYNLDSKLCDEIRQHLKNQQEGIGLLINIIKDDLEDLKVIELGVKEVAERRRQVV